VGGNEKRYWVWSEVLCTCKDWHEFSQWLFAWPDHLQVQEWTTSENWYKIQVGTRGFVWNLCSKFSPIDLHFYVVWICLTSFGLKWDILPVEYIRLLVTPCHTMLFIMINSKFLSVMLLHPQKALKPLCTETDPLYSLYITCSLFEVAVLLTYCMQNINSVHTFESFGSYGINWPK
jgi:hypothetical protein